jgi:alkanesulfonate monooxygenase SsuD/methylene tetrahydromethanopterin reductase-like flavin-dependent oxidoreductase (luciferase family)
VRLGVAVGWLRGKFEALGAEIADRGARIDEYVDAMAQPSIENRY